MDWSPWVVAFGVLATLVVLIVADKFSLNAEDRREEEMGSGPAYDARDTRIDQERAERQRKLSRRIGYLEDMIRDVGLGEHDADTRIEKLAAARLQEAYDLMLLLVRPRA